jgi:hypothetical protein
MKELIVFISSKNRCRSTYSGGADGRTYDYRALYCSIPLLSGSVSFSHHGNSWFLGHGVRFLYSVEEEKLTKL